jgi:hypothetical protein
VVNAVYRGTFKFTKDEMLARDEVEAYMFGRMDERLAVVELLSQYLEDPRLVKEVLEEIIERISARGV